MTWREAPAAAQKQYRDGIEQRRLVSTRAHRAGLSYREIAEGLGLSTQMAYKLVAHDDEGLCPSIDLDTPMELNGNEREGVHGMSDGAMSADYREECYVAAGGDELPVWIPVETIDGARTEAEARKIMADWWGDDDGLPWKVSRVQMYVGEDEYGSLRVHPKPDGMTAGPFDFWMFEEVM